MFSPPPLLSSCSSAKGEMKSRQKTENQLVSTIPVIQFFVADPELRQGLYGISSEG